MQLDLVDLRRCIDPLVMVVHGHGQNLLRPVLTDHIVVQDILDFGRLGKLGGHLTAIFLALLSDDLIAQVDAFVADIHRRTGN